MPPAGQHLEPGPDDLIEAEEAIEDWCEEIDGEYSEIAGGKDSMYTERCEVGDLTVSLRHNRDVDVDPVTGRMDVPESGYWWVETKIEGDERAYMHNMFDADRIESGGEVLSIHDGDELLFKSRKSF